MTGGINYRYNGDNRLISATVGGSTATYDYDADGRRFRQTRGVTVTNYLWDEASAYGDVVAELNSGGSVQTSYVLGGQQLISQKRGANSSDYFLMDGLGSVRTLANSSETIIDRYNYDSFGRFCKISRNESFLEQICFLIPLSYLAPVEYSCHQGQYRRVN